MANKQKGVATRFICSRSYSLEANKKAPRGRGLQNHDGLRVSQRPTPPIASTARSTAKSIIVIVKPPHKPKTGFSPPLRHEG